MVEKRHRITLLFNANKAYDRQVVEGVGEYLQASQSEWDIFIEEDFRVLVSITSVSGWETALSLTYDDEEIEPCSVAPTCPHHRCGRLLPSIPNIYPQVHYIATDNFALIERAFLHLKEKGMHRFAFYGLPTSSGKRWAEERELAFRQLMEREQYRGVVYQGQETAPETGSTPRTGWRTGCKRCRPRPASSP
jgi:LacI family transcriptional regulator